MKAVALYFLGLAFAFTMGLLAEHERAERANKVGRVDFIYVDGHCWKVSPAITNLNHVADCEKCLRPKKTMPNLRFDADRQDGREVGIDWILADGHRFRVDPPLDSVTHVEACEQCLKEKGNP